MSDEKARLGRWPYAVSVIILLTGLVTFGVLLARGVAVFTGLPSAVQMVVPGTGEFTLPEAGTYGVCYEYETVVEGQAYSTGKSVPDLQCEVREKATGSVVALSPASSGTNYSSGNKSWVLVWNFEVDQPGTYELSAGYPEGDEEPEVVLAIRPRVVKEVTGGVIGLLGAVGILVGACVVALAIIVVAFVIRSRPGSRGVKAP